MRRRTIWQILIVAYVQQNLHMNFLALFTEYNLREIGSVTSPLLACSWYLNICFLYIVCSDCAQSEICITFLWGKGKTKFISQFYVVSGQKPDVWFSLYFVHLNSYENYRKPKRIIRTVMIIIVIVILVIIFLL